jgi:aspartate oxidase
MRKRVLVLGGNVAGPTAALDLVHRVELVHATATRIDPATRWAETTAGAKYFLWKVRHGRTRLP